MADMYLEYVRLDQIRRAPQNPKLHAELDIQRSIAEHGAGEPPLLDERTGQLLAGHGRLDAYLALHDAGRPAPRNVEVDDDGMWRIPVTRGFSSRTDEHAAAYLIASNHLVTKGGYDDRDLAEMLGELQDVNMLTLTGFTDADLAALIRSLEGEDDTPPGGDAPPDDLGEKTWGVYVEADNEHHQEKILSELSNLGYAVRPA